MALYLQIIAGENVGTQYPLFEGARMGRTTGEILVNDKKISSLHAQVEKEQTGQLCLVDRASSNGIIASGQKVQRLALLPGVLFIAGKTTFKVVEIAEQQQQMSPKETALHWKDILLYEIPKLIAVNSSEPNTVKAFDPMVKLTIVEGIQTDREILLGYGPRKFGSQVLDIELYDSESPVLAFEIHPDEGGSARFQTTESRIVLFNNKPTNVSTIRDGDEIRVGKTLLRVNYEKS